MPARWLRAIFTLIAVVFLVRISVEAQTGGTSVSLKGAVSETVALSILPTATDNDIEMNVVRSGNTVRMTLSGSNTESPVIRVPLIVRSNSGFRISADFEAETAVLTQLSVMDVRATGTLVSPAGISELAVPQHFDGRGLSASSVMNSSPLDISRPLLVLSGPRVSLGGTLESPNNALQITLLIRMKPEPGRRWLVQVTFTGTAVNIL
jgi:hypothetical protein